MSPIALVFRKSGGSPGGGLPKVAWKTWERHHENQLVANFPHVWNSKLNQVCSVPHVRAPKIRILRGPLRVLCLQFSAEASGKLWASSWATKDMRNRTFSVYMVPLFS